MIQSKVILDVRIPVLDALVEGLVLSRLGDVQLLRDFIADRELNHIPFGVLVDDD